MNNTFNILCLEDSPEDFGLINYHLSQADLDFSAERVDTKEEFITALGKTAFNLVLSDHSLPQFDSLEALKLVRESRPELPFILVTGAVSEEFAVNCLRLGADDYVLKTNLKDLKEVIVKSVRNREEQAVRARMEKELARRNEELARMNKELDSFVYSVTHNLRSPLRSILGLLNLSKGETQLDAIHQYHELMEKCVAKLDKDLLDILEYSRNSREEFRVEKVNIKTVINDAFEKMQFMPGFDNLKTTVNIVERASLFSDAYRLSVILNNIISNAVKYQDPLKTESRLDITGEVNSECLYLEIKDNGIGINPSQITNVFRMFSRATEKAEGAGLGLYIVKEAIDLLKGEISVQSEEHIGTTFVLKIPNNLTEGCTD